MTHSTLPIEKLDIEQQSILEEAAEWLTLIHSGEFTKAHQEKLQQWQTQSPRHQSAWNKAEAILKTLHQAPEPLTRRTLEGADQHARRRMLKTFAIMLLATPTVWLGNQLKPWQTWTADFHTASGEQKTVELPDHSQLVLNTASSVKLNFNETQRQVLLIQGEILVKTATDTTGAPRPFIVTAKQGSMRALGTEFAIRQFADHSQLVVLQGSVEITTLSTQSQQIVRAGQQTIFTNNSIGSSQPTNPQTTLWTKGMLLAKAMRLEDLVIELSRYHTGKIRCDPSIADMKVSGAFPVTDINACLTLLYKTLPLRISYITQWWITLQPLA